MSGYPYYRLELLPLPGCEDLYTSVRNRSNENAGFDLFVAERCVTLEGEVSLVNLGCKARMVKCFEKSEEEVPFWLAPRSSIWKSGVTQANSIGVIDKSYRGPLMGAVLPIPKQQGYWSHDSGTYVWMNCDMQYSAPILERGQRLFQIVAPDMGHIMEIQIVDKLPETERGEGGFGSTGR